MELQLKKTNLYKTLSHFLHFIQCAMEIKSFQLMLLDPKTLNVCKLTAWSPPSSSFIIFEPAASLIRPQAYRPDKKCSTQRDTRSVSRVASLWLIFGCNNFLCQQNSIFGLCVSQEANETWFALDDIRLPCLSGARGDLLLSRLYKQCCHFS